MKRGIMTFLTALLVTAGSLILSGSALLFSNEALQRRALTSLRSPAVTVVCFGTAAAWFLWDLFHLSEAELTHYRYFIFGGFLLLVVLTFTYVREFLAVRGLAILALLAAAVLLDSAYIQAASTARLFFVTFVYVMILTALYLGTVPFRLRDFLEWLFAQKRRRHLLGSLMTFYGLVLAAMACTDM